MRFTLHRVSDKMQTHILHFAANWKRFHFCLSLQTHTYTHVHKQELSYVCTSVFRIKCFAYLILSDISPFLTAAPIAWSFIFQFLTTNPQSNSVYFQQFSFLILYRQMCEWKYFAKINDERERKWENDVEI